MRIADVVAIADSHENLMLTYWNVDFKVLDGDRFVETTSEPCVHEKVRTE